MPSRINSILRRKLKITSDKPASLWLEGERNIKQQVSACFMAMQLKWKTNLWRATFILLLSALILLPQIVFAESISLEALLRPLAYLDLSQIYDQYAAIIDLFIYTLIFVGVARVSFERRFPGRAGKALCVGVGFALALGLAAAERQYGFSLRSFGPIAAVVLLLVLGVFIHHFLRGSGVSRLHAIAVAYAILFVIVLGVAPEALMSLANSMPLAGLVLAILFILSLLNTLMALLPYHNMRRLIDPGYRNALQDDPVRRWDEEAAYKEKRFIKRKLRSAAKEEESEVSEEERDIDEAGAEIRRHGADPRRVPAILHTIQKAIARAEALRRQTHNLRDMNERLKRYDTTLFSRKSQERLANIGSEAKALLAKEIRDEVERLDIEAKADRIEETPDRHVEELTRTLEAAAVALQSGQPDRAAQIIQASKAPQEAISKLANLIRKLEEYLLALAKSDVRIERKMA
ncbi:MAG: hypothetical protein NTX50_26940 [Candidatus Sumerlaeota bacterium]|nr:hypothetical protein [Candidatus Sumerlaeota bacterium]